MSFLYNTNNTYVREQLQRMSDTSNQVDISNIEPGMFSGILDFESHVNTLHDAIVVQPAIAGSLVVGGALSVVDTELSDPWFESTTKELIDYRKEVRSDPMTTGIATEILSEVAKFGLQLFMAGPAGVGILSGATESTEQLESGKDLSTSLKMGASTGLSSSLAAMIPAAFGSNLHQRLITGAGANVGLGAIDRYAKHKILEDKYPEEANHYKWLDAKYMAIDAVLGIAFGGLAHWHIKPGEITPSQIDAALVANANRQKMDAAPGIPKTAEAAEMAVKVADEHVAAAIEGREPVLHHKPDDYIIDTDAIAAREEASRRFEQEATGEALTGPDAIVDVVDPVTELSALKEDLAEFSDPAYVEEAMKLARKAVKAEMEAELDGFDRKIRDLLREHEIIIETRGDSNDKNEILDNIEKEVESLINEKNKLESTLEERSKRMVDSVLEQEMIPLKERIQELEDSLVEQSKEQEDPPAEHKTETEEPLTKQEPIESETFKDEETDLNKLEAFLAKDTAGITDKSSNKIEKKQSELNKLEAFLAKDIESKKEEIDSLRAREEEVDSEFEPTESESAAGESKKVNKTVIESLKRISDDDPNIEVPMEVEGEVKMMKLSDAIKELEEFVDFAEHADEIMLTAVECFLNLGDV